MLRYYSIFEHPFAKGTHEIPNISVIDYTGKVLNDVTIVYHSISYNDSGWPDLRGISPGKYVKVNKKLDIIPHVAYGKTHFYYAVGHFGNIFFKEPLVEDDLKKRPPEPVEVSANEFLFLKKLIPWHAGSLGNGLFTLFKMATLNKLSQEQFYSKYPTLSFNAPYRKFVVVPQDLPSSVFPQFNYTSTNGISDCGFASLTGIRRTESPNEFSALMTLFTLEVILASAGYIIFSTQGNSTASNNPYEPVRILKEIAQLNSVINPNQNDYINHDLTKREAGRGRQFGFINHYTLLDYYQSDSFKKLKLTI